MKKKIISFWNTPPPAKPQQPEQNTLKKNQESRLPKFQPDEESAKMTE